MKPPPLWKLALARRIGAVPCGGGCGRFVHPDPDDVPNPHPHRLRVEAAYLLIESWAPPR